MIMPQHFIRMNEFLIFYDSITAVCVLISFL